MFGRNGGGRTCVGMRGEEFPKRGYLLADLCVGMSRGSQLKPCRVIGGVRAQALLHPLLQNPGCSGTDGVVPCSPVQRPDGLTKH